MTGMNPEIEHVIIGTAGHIDHGKTALVKALTGIDADTLSEEKRRGITIELGFIFMDIPGYRKQIVFIDVPGHEKLVKTMVAGASNIDAALLVIAADEGISLQTLEHFDILRLLGIQKGIVVLTKADLVDEERIRCLEEEVGSLVRGSFLENAPVIPVSAVSGSGIDNLKSELKRVGNELESRKDSGIFRMPIDRVFTIKGFGTVIAGTVLSGEVKTGDKIEIFPEGFIARVRGIQVHHSQAEKSVIGRRTALNLMDVRKEDLRRGQCAGMPGSLIPTNRLDGRLYLLKSFRKELRNRTRIRFHTGTAEIISRIILLDKEGVLPGESGLVQFVLESPTVAVPGDRFIVRSFSPVMTIGGGTILDAVPPKHKRFNSLVIEGLKRLEGDRNDVVEQMFIKSRFFPQAIQDIALRTGESRDVVAEAVSNLQGAGKIVKIVSGKNEKYLHKTSYEELGKKLESFIKDYLEKNPHRLFIPYVDLRSRILRLTDEDTFKTIFDELCRRNKIYKKDSSVGLVGYELKLKPREEEYSEKIEKVYLEAGFAAPIEEDVRLKLELEPSVFKNIMSSLLDKGILVRLSRKVTYHGEFVKKAEELVLKLIEKNKHVTISQLRNELGLSRKYAQAILEYFDSTGLTRREGDRHVLK